ncbi:hypothetical protein [Methanopyrus kandleri]|uniref:Uncharacterized domain specific for M.kandleri, MK-11 family n=1 Tax=Methanopyrus kandleri (strain AV19 / DSM 6324 / JCM 9639 / NBRC 100938) TaxID=190192 RepID=Q8TVT5_METKA|nr:hypothetical protein [Methanopyrus kandleri]AAM02516.1 Uncharacterized domain specific for M.kandleri, MK-11 family [Methanopyrus kandleri AV19]
MRVRWVLLPALLALVLPLPVHGDAWVGPEALLDVGVQSDLIIEDVHLKESDHGVEVVDHVDAEYRAYIRVKEPGKPVTLHVLLPQGTEVLEARFYPELYPIEGIDLDSPDVNVKWERIEPVSRSEVTWKVLGWTWRWTQLDFRVTPKYDERRHGCSALVLKLRIPTAHREPEEIDRLPIAGPKHYPELGSYYYFGCIEWPAPLQPSGRGGGFNCWATSDAWSPHVLFLWPGGFADIQEGFTNVSLTDHLVLTLGGSGGGSGAAVDVVGVREEGERVVQSEWPRVTGRFGFPYVPVVAVIGLEKKEPSSPKTGRKPEREKPAKHELPVPPIVPPPMRGRRRLTGKASNSSP